MPTLPTLNLLLMMYMKKIIYERRKWNENEKMIVAVNAIYAIA